MTILEQVKNSKDQVVALRRHFHRNPEASRQEFDTAQKIKAELDSIGIPNQFVDGTGVFGIIKGSLPGSKVIVLRADTDALPVQDDKEVEYKSQRPGFMHACGHDFQTSALLGAARILQQNRDAFGGEIRLFFQHAEEIGYGAKQFIQAGILEGAGRVFGIHAASNVPTGKVAIRSGTNNASVDHFKIEIKGYSSHVSTPEEGIDALYVAAQLVVALQAVVTRLTSPITPVLIGIGKLTSGTAYNVVADSALLEGTTRTVTPELRRSVNQQIERVTQNIAAAYGATASIQWTDYASPLINDAQVCAEISQLTGQLFGPGQVVDNRPLSLAGDDFAEFIQNIPGAYAFVGTGNPADPNTLEPHHSSRFDIDEEALEVATALYAEYPVRWLNNSFSLQE